MAVVVGKRNNPCRRAVDLPLGAIAEKEPPAGVGDLKGAELASEWIRRIDPVVIGVETIQAHDSSSPTVGRPCNLTVAPRPVVRGGGRAVWAAHISIDPVIVVVGAAQVGPQQMGPRQTRGDNSPGKKIHIVVSGIAGCRKKNLPEVGSALGALGGLDATPDRREQQRDENRDDGDHDQKLDQGEPYVINGNADKTLATRVETKSKHGCLLHKMGLYAFLRRDQAAFLTEGGGHTKFVKVKFCN